MQRAGLAVARLALAVAPHARTVWIACGPGNNGGDGFEAAVHLQRLGQATPSSPGWATQAGCRPMRAASLQRARAAGVALRAAAARARGTSRIDALLGIGGARAARGRAGRTGRSACNAGAGAGADRRPALRPGRRHRRRRAAVRATHTLEPADAQARPLHGAGPRRRRRRSGSTTSASPPAAETPAARLPAPPAPRRAPARDRTRAAMATSR